MRPRVGDMETGTMAGAETFRLRRMALFPSVFLALRVTPLLFALCFSTLALTFLRSSLRHDRAQFLSIVGPPTATAVLVLLIPPSVAVRLDVLAGLWYLPFVFGGARFAAFWWRFVLRRH